MPQTGSITVCSEIAAVALLAQQLPFFSSMAVGAVYRPGSATNFSRQRAEQKLAGVEAKLAELARIRDGLRTLIKACPGHGALDACPILHALDEDAA